MHSPTDDPGARTRLLRASLHLFAQHGYARTSTREIAQAAGVNLSAIRYYFGGKAGLYRAAFNEPMVDSQSLLARFDQPGLSLRDALHRMLMGAMAPYLRGEVTQDCMRLHFRERVDPTGMWTDELEQVIKPAHASLLRVLSRHLGLPEAAAPEDDELHRLAFSIAALPLSLYLSRDVYLAIRPQLVEGPGAIETAVLRMLDLALAMVEGEARRRGLSLPTH